METNVLNIIINKNINEKTNINFILLKVTGSRYFFYFYFHLNEYIIKLYLNHI